LRIEIIASAQIARRGGLLIEQVCESKVCELLKNSQFAIIRFSQLKLALQYPVKLATISKGYSELLLNDYSYPVTF